MGRLRQISQGVLTGEISPFHPGQTPIKMIEEPSGVIRTVDPAELQFDPELRMPYTDRYSIGMDRQIGGRLQCPSRTSQERE